jgi:hypothetical protein
MKEAFQRIKSMVTVNIYMQTKINTKDHIFRIKDMDLESFMELMVKLLKVFTNMDKNMVISLLIKEGMFFNRIGIMEH